MQISIGLPSMIPGVAGDQIIEWARRSDSGPFRSLSVLDRVVYPNYEPLVTLAVAAGVTRRIRLMTTILIAPLRNPANLAKQAASLDALSGGRLTLGLGVGGREDDFRVSGVPFQDRGRRFDKQLELMYKTWSGEPVEGVGAVGPPPAREGGPEVLIGGYTEAAISRIGRWGDGYISGGGGPARAQQGYELARSAWSSAGRSGRPRFVAASYYALGPDAAERGAAYIRHYYAFAGPMADRIAEGIPAGAAAIGEAVAAFRDIGVDELVLWPTTPDLDQIETLADLVS